MRRLTIIISVGMVLCVFLAGEVYSKTLEEMKAEIREEVRREFGITPSSTPTREPADRVERPSVKSITQQESGGQVSLYDEIFGGIDQETIVISVVSLFLLAFIPATVAAIKGRNFLLWLIMSLLFLPFTLPISVIIKNKKKKPQVPEGEAKETPVSGKKKSAEPTESEAKEAEGSSAVDIYNQIEKLAELKEKGVISEEEFAKKKNQLLDRI